MGTAANWEYERLELEAVLRSGIFDRAPSLAQLLTYICSKCFAGEGDQIKEYNIAVEALGRPPDFDPKRDSIVRVEAHRLRKRLQEHYAREGESHAVQIVIPLGRYTPKFVFRQELVAAPAPSLPETSKEPPIQFARVVPWYRRPIWLTTPVLALGMVMLGAFWPRNQVGSKPLIGVVDANPRGAVRILAGNESGSYVDGYGRQWVSDRYFSGGSVFATPDHSILGSRDAALYQNRREGSFRYDIPLKPGIYELRLHFAETLYGDGNTAGGGEASRLFNVFANGREVLHEFDVTGEVGPSTADVKVWTDVSPASDGNLHLRFEGSTGAAFLNAIEITPGIAHALVPIRFVARDQGLTDSEGRYWEPDRLARGGQLVVRSQPVSLTPNPELFRGERFGNLTYSVPVPPGSYRLTLYFAETWFGPNKPGRGGTGSRVFDIFCNGLALAREFDIYRRAAGSDRALVRSFAGLKPNSQGKLVISLLPVKNYACVNAMEITSEGLSENPLPNGLTN